MKLFTILMVTGLSSLLSLAWAEESPTESAEFGQHHVAGDRGG